VEDRAYAKIARRAGLQLTVLGVVFGDIGTSPLYALRECLVGEHGVRATPENVLGVLSLVIWALMLVVSFKYLTVIMRANNQGEGGIFALLALLPDRTHPSPAGRLAWPALLVMFGAGLLYGDGMITPAISVLSALEGLESTAPALRPAVVPLTCAVLVGLFLLQRRGTGGVGRLFGPVMAAWFVAIGSVGAFALARHPSALAALNPWYAVRFFQAHGARGALVLGSVVLAVTGGEALYADMGHFGAPPIRRAWFALVLPALVLSYLGQGAHLLSHPTEAGNPFFSLVPRGPLTLALVFLSTVATIIASQALISGAFSMTHQAAQLGFLPSMTVRHTSSHREGQIYIPEINALLAFACLLLVLTFRQSSRLASAYGLAVTGTMTITSLVFFDVARATWRWPLWKALPLLLLFLAIDLPFLGANLFKLVDGGFIPVLVGLGFFLVMKTWRRGRQLYKARTELLSQDLEDFLRACDSEHTVRSPVTGICLTGQDRGVAPVLRRLMTTLHVVPETVVFLTVHVGHAARVGRVNPVVRALGHGVYRVVVEYGFMDYVHVPEVLEIMSARDGVPADPAHVTYVAGRDTFAHGNEGSMGRWSERLFALLARNARPVTERLDLPPDQVVEIGSRIDL
jgi:KUP system potassium uptake protein